MNKQPTTLPWHREAAKDVNQHCDTRYTCDAVIAAIIAKHDPHAAQESLLARTITRRDVLAEELDAAERLHAAQHAETLRLLERAQVVLLKHADENRDLWHEIRAHLAAHSNPDGKKGSQ